MILTSSSSLCRIFWPVSSSVKSTASRSSSDCQRQELAMIACHPRALAQNNNRAPLASSCTCCTRLVLLLLHTPGTSFPYCCHGPQNPAHDILSCNCVLEYTERQLTRSSSAPRFSRTSSRSAMLSNAPCDRKNVSRT